MEPKAQFLPLLVEASLLLGVSMHIVLGGTGHVGSALVDALLARGEPVTMVVRDRSKARPFEARGAHVEVADVHDFDALKRAYRSGDRLFMLNPPADPSTDTQAQERETVANMLRALRGSAIKKVVAESTFGARPGELIGDLNVLYEMEQGLERSGIPLSVMMVAPKDLGHVAAKLMTAPVEHTEHVLVEGPERYSSADVAAAYAGALQREVKAEVIRERDWLDTFKALGFSDRAAMSYANMTRTLFENDFPSVDETLHGKVSLDQYIRDQVNSATASR
jgi:uncharacterized protein YbjT (DUF2867 family)